MSRLPSPRSLRPRLIGAMLLLVAALAAGCGGSGPAEPAGDPPARRAPGAPATADGSAWLELPAGALPEGVSASDIGIVRIAVEPPGEDYVGPMAALELTPDGLQLAKPALLRIRLDADTPVDGLLATHISADGVELVSGIETEVDVGTGDTIASIPVTHFSELGLFQTTIWWLFEVTTSPAEVRAVVGEQFTVTAVVRRVRDRMLFSPARNLFVLPGKTADDNDYPLRELAHAGDRWTLSGRFAVRDGPRVRDGVANVSPTVVDDVPPTTSVSALSFTVRQDFICRQEGFDFIDYSADLEVPVTSTRVELNGDRTSTGETVVRYPHSNWPNVRVDCVAPSPAATAPNLTAPSPGGVLQVPQIGGGSTPTPTTAPAAVPGGVLSPGDYRVTAKASEGSCAGHPTSFDKSLLIEVRGTASAAQDVTIWDARTPYRGKIDATTGTFEAGSGAKYSGVLRNGFPDTIAFTVPFPGCLGTYQVTLTPAS